MLFDTILFDLDDTLHHRYKSIELYLESFLNELFPEVDSLTRKKYKDAFYEADGRGYIPKDEAYRRLKDIFPWLSKIDEQMFLAYWDDVYSSSAMPMDDLYEVLSHFSSRGIKMGMVTNGDSVMQNTKIDKLMLRKYMKAIIISGEVNIEKPDKRIYSLALEKTCSKPETTLFVGDYPATDIKGAVMAGLIPVWMSFGREWNIAEYKPRYIINCLSELKHI